MYRLCLTNLTIGAYHVLSIILVEIFGQGPVTEPIRSFSLCAETGRRPVEATLAVL